MSRVRSIRASESDWLHWDLTAAHQKLSLNAWARLTLNAEADRLAAERRRAEAARAERDRLLAVKRGDWEGRL